MVRADDALAAELRQLAEQNAVLAAIGRIITSSLDISEIYPPLGEQVRRLIPFDRIDIVTADLKRGTLRVEYVHGVDIETERSKAGFTRPLPGSMVEAIVQRNSPITFTGRTREEMSADFPPGVDSFDAGIRSEILVPLMAAGSPMGMISLMSTEPYVYEQAHVDLAQRVSNQISGAIANARLYARAMVIEEELRRSNADLEQFAYVASHDLQEPLRMVASYMQLLDRRYGEKLGQDAQDFIGFAVDGAQRMQRLIDDLLAYSRIGTRGVPFEPTDSEVAFNRAMGNLEVGIEETGADVTHRPLPIVIGDSGQLVQLFQNLIGNGIKFSGPDAPKVRVDAVPVEAGWQFSVDDNGIGIDSRYSERIFELFRRLHGRDEYPGTGIGLAICKKIVERHGGTIWVASEPGMGSTFYFTLQSVDQEAGI